MPAEHPALAPCRQLLLVLAPEWESGSGQLYQYERATAEEPWRLLQVIPVSLGKTGLAWGVGLHGAAPAGPVKREGDQKSPAGIFALGPAFGYDAQSPIDPGALPYTRITDQTFGIEDPGSVHYNTIVDRATIPAPDWSAADHMLRPDNLYHYGVMVQHNPHPGAQPAALGSCIFLHVWRGAGQTTAGCTAMEEAKVAALSTWLRTAAEPRLVQLTEGEYHRLRDDWGLPHTPEPPPMTFALLGLAALVMGLAGWLYARRRRAVAKT